jgi:hypothetical protein
MEEFLRLFWGMVVGHAVADYPLQNETMATEKDRHSTTPLQAAVPWYYWLTAHALIHGGAVSLVTGSIWFGLAEMIVHWLLDFGKCEGWTNIHQDQALHIGCKGVWAALAPYVNYLTH